MTAGRSLSFAELTKYTSLTPSLIKLRGARAIHNNLKKLLFNYT